MMEPPPWHKYACQLHTSRRVYRRITQYEVMRHVATRDKHGKWIIGYHHVLPCRLSLVIDNKEASAIMRDDLQQLEALIASQVRVLLSQSQFDALVEFLYCRRQPIYEMHAIAALLNMRKYTAVHDVMIATSGEACLVQRGWPARLADIAARWNEPNDEKPTNRVD
jgi:lysozyme